MSTIDNQREPQPGPGVPGTYLRSAWYVAGYASELESRPLLGRKLLDHPVVMFRDEGGQVRAIRNRCPHRLVPLSMGRLDAGVVVCGYHGLGFDGGGRCVRNPHGEASSIRALSVPSYPLRERGGLLWIWMGEAAEADERLIPDYECLDTQRFFVGTGYLYGNANYELMTDNILDLSHIEFLHPALGTEAVSRAKVEVTTGNGGLTTTRRMIDEILPPRLAHVYQTGAARVNRTMAVTWQAPANMVLRVTIRPSDPAETWARESQTLHLFTPETQRSTHYFYVGTLARATATQELEDLFLAALGKAFLHEDKPMIDAQQDMIGDADIMDLKPALLPIDKAGVIARRLLGRLIAAQGSA